MKTITFTTLFLALFELTGFSQNKTKTQLASNTADYKVTLISLSPLKISVNASIPVNGKMLDMDKTYPADLPEMAEKGWPALISNLVVCDLSGKKIAITAAGNKGWHLADSLKSILKLSYDVDYSLLAASGWSSFLESAFVYDNNAVVVGRSVFITTKEISEVRVKFVTPKGWMSIVPWTANKDSVQNYRVKLREDLINNMLVFSKNKPNVVTASGFKMQIVTMGHWRPFDSLVNQILKTIISREVDLMNYKETEIYSVILSPISDEGGNAFRQSFVYCYNNPTPSNKDIWGNTLAHEIFHYWNYARLKGADYASSQWFQEGFTEYVANLIMVTGKIIDSTAFLNKLSEHVNNYRKLTTTLENYGTHKGPPLYSAGALVAFMWDIKIRETSKKKRNIGNFFRNLMTQTNSGIRKYTWIDIKAALQNTADIDWESFYQSYIKGDKPLPFDQILPLAGLHLIKIADGSEQVAYDSTKSMEAKNLFNTLMGDWLKADK